MAKIKNIQLFNFRNFKNYKTTFDDKLNILFGDNGSGKTNILEGISLIAKGRGIRNSSIVDLIKKKQDNFKIKNILEIQKNTYDVDISLDKNNYKYKKIIRVNEDSSKESLNFLNKSISFLVFLPEMERLFQASPSYRRNFIDRLIFSARKDYNTLINKYKKYLIERIKILKEDNFDNHWLNEIEKNISIIGLEIYETRYKQLQLLNNNIRSLDSLGKFRFSIDLKFKDSFFNKGLDFDNYLSSLRDSRYFDKLNGGTKIGPHRSDIIAVINNEFEASSLSTGQQKTVVLMILLAQCHNLINNNFINPIILFDEIGSHLDSFNRNILLDMINRFDIQFFLTGTEKNIFSFISTKAEFYNISDI